jgi:hypothetical protein
MMQNNLNGLVRNGVNGHCAFVREVTRGASATSISYLPARCLERYCLALVEDQTSPTFG